MEQTIRETRKQLDAIYNAMQERIDSRELALAATSFQLAFMWFGKSLGSLGSPNPYPASTDPKSKVIEAQADSADEPFVLRGGRIAGVKYLRSMCDTMQNQVESAEDVFMDLNDNIESMDDYVTVPQEIYTAKVYLQEAKMWLGQELNSIKKKEDAMGTARAMYHDIRTEEAKKAYGRYLARKDDAKSALKWDDMSVREQDAWKETVSPFIQTPEQMMQRGLQHPPKPDPWGKEDDEMTVAPGPIGIDVN